MNNKRKEVLEEDKGNLELKIKFYEQEIEIIEEELEDYKESKIIS